MITIKEVQKKRNWEYIEWQDANGPESNKWISREELEDIVYNCVFINRSVGLVVHEDKKFITIVSDISDNVWNEEEIEHTRMLGYLRIPTTWILKRVKLNSLINKK